MIVKARLKNLRIAPRKVRLVADLIRGKKVDYALNQLEFLVKASAEPMKKLLKQAVANAENNFNLNKEDLYISKIIINEGITLKRWLPRSRGRADQILKESSHIILELDEIKKDEKILKTEKKGKKTTETKVEKVVEKPVKKSKKK